MERVIDAIAGLATTAASITEESTYVQDLETVWSARLRAVGAGRPEDQTVEFAAAIDRLITEVARITDPHRAIDWMSTLPQAVLVALGEEAW